MSRIVLWLFVGLSLGGGMAYMFSQPYTPALPVETKIFSPEIVESNFTLHNLTLGVQGTVYGSRGNGVYRIIDNGQLASLVYTFSNRVTAVHQGKNGLLIVATDDDHWDPRKPCRIYRSIDNGLTFEQSKTIEEGSVLWWSIDTDRVGRVYLAEYGPQRIGMSKTLWRSDSAGLNWQAIYTAPDKDKVHLHRIAVDPYTDDLWLTVGDGTNRAMLTSSDSGDNWQQVERLQSTAVAFDEKAIFWGRDKKSKPGVLRYDRKTKKFSRWFNPRKEGNYAGSIYDMLLLPSGELIVPFMKYPDQSHVASLWRGRQGEWVRLMQLASETDKGTGFETIAGPDKDGWVYMSGYQMKVGAE